MGSRTGQRVGHSGRDAGWSAAGAVSGLWFSSSSSGMARPENWSLRLLDLGRGDGGDRDSSPPLERASSGSDPIDVFILPEDGGLDQRPA